MVGLEKSQAIFWYVAVPTGLCVLMFVGFAVHETSKPWPPLTIIKKETRHAGRYELTAKSRPEDGPGSLTATDDYPKDFYDKARIGDTLVFGFCHERLERDGSIVAIRVGWFAVPFLLGADAWFALCVVLIAKPTLLQRGLCGWSAAIAAIGSALKATFQKAGLVLRMEARAQPAAESRCAAHADTGRSTVHVDGPWQTSRLRRCLNWLLLPVPLFIPELFFRAYQPINESMTVKWLGCSCPFLDGSPRLFNANDFNAILWLIVFAATTVFWVRQFERALSQAPPIPRAVCGGIGIAVIWFWSMKRYAAGFWL
jgi:hypothetical protein